MADNDDVWRRRFHLFALVRLAGLAIFFLGVAIAFSDLVRDGGKPEVEWAPPAKNEALIARVHGLAYPVDFAARGSASIGVSLGRGRVSCGPRTYRVRAAGSPVSRRSKTSNSAETLLLKRTASNPTFFEVLFTQLRFRTGRPRGAAPGYSVPDSSTAEPDP